MLSIQAGHMDYSLLVGVHRRRFRVGLSAAAPASARGGGGGGGGGGSGSGVGLTSLGVGGPDLLGKEDGGAVLLADDGGGGGGGGGGVDERCVELGPLRGLHTNEGLRAAVVEGPGVYYLGIVDILTEWDFHRRLQNFTKAGSTRPRVPRACHMRILSLDREE